MQNGSERGGGQPPADGRIPVSLLTGFLGSGKTTLLNALMKQPGMAGTAILINEFGEVGIDHHLVGSLDETMIRLDSGCLCCSMRGDLVSALKDLHERLSKQDIPPITRVLIETTGLADPVPVVSTLMEERFTAARFVCDSVLTVIDATHGLKQLAEHDEALRQAAMADRLLISKTDLVDGQDRAALHARLDALNPHAIRLEVRNGQIDADLLFGGGLYSVDGRLPDVAAWLGREAAQTAPDGPHDHHSHRHDHDHDHGHDEDCVPCAKEASHRHADHRHDAGRHGGGISSFTVTFDTPVPWRSFSVAMAGILTMYGPRLLRVKGLMGLAGDRSPVVIQCVEDTAYPPVRLAAWPDDDAFRSGRLVFITKDLRPAEIEAIRRSLMDLPSDAAAARTIANTPFLPTRCWLSLRVPAHGVGRIELDGWSLQRPTFANRARSPGFRTGL